jgi:hypothetical protein
MSFQILLWIGVVLVGLLAIVALFYFGLSRPVNETQDPSQPRYQYFSERERRSGRFRKKK